MSPQKYTCLDCNSENIDIPETALFSDTVICIDCGAEFKYGEFRSTMETGQMDALPVAAVQIINE